MARIGRSQRHRRRYCEVERMTLSVESGFAQSVMVFKAFELASRGSPDFLRAATSDALNLLRPLAHFEMASLSYWDEGSNQHSPVVNFGYPSHIVALCDALIHTDETFHALRERRTPLRLRGLSAPALSGTVGTKVIQRNSFRDGLTHCFFSRDGRYLGYMNLTSLSRDLNDSATHIVQLLEAAIVPVLMSAALPAPDGTCDSGSLTSREREVLALLPSGSTNNEIARALSISPTTVARHVEHIIAKLGAQNRTRAACLAIELGLLG